MLGFVKNDSKSMLKLHFEANLQYQLDAIASVVGLFDGVPYVRAQDRLFAGVCANDLHITLEAVHENRDRIAKLNNILDI